MDDIAREEIIRFVEKETEIVGGWKVNCLDWMITTTESLGLPAPWGDDQVETEQHIVLFFEAGYKFDSGEKRLIAGRAYIARMGEVSEADITKRIRSTAVLYDACIGPKGTLVIGGV